MKTAIAWREQARYVWRMQTVPTKQRILDALSDLEEDASIEDAIERLCFLAKTERGLAQLDAGESVDHDELKRPNAEGPVKSYL